ncbi:MAG: hypothetical protein AAGI53_05245 [Planctomycetota bacterium]
MKLAWIAPSLAIAALVSGCGSPQEQAAHRAAELRWEIADAVIAAEVMPVREVDWNGAVDLLRERGPAVIRADQAVERAHIAAGRPYKNLIPTIDFRVGVVEQVDSLADLTTSDLLFDVFITNLLSGLANLPEQVFVTRLALLRTELQREQSWREQIIVLHTLFLQSAALDERLRLAELARAGAERADDAGFDAVVGLGPEELDDETRDIARDRHELNQRLGALLGEPAVRWMPDGPVPAIKAEGVLGPGLEERLMNSLVLRLAATDLVAADAAVRSAWYEYLPQPEIFISAPPIFTQTGDDQTVFELGNLTLTARLRLSVDLRGAVAERIKLANLDRDTAIRETRLAVRTAAVEAVRLNEELDRLVEERDEAARRLDLVVGALEADGISGLQRRLREAARARDAIARAELAEVALVGPLLTLDSVWASTFPYADARTPGRTPLDDQRTPAQPESHDADTATGVGAAPQNRDTRGDTGEPERVVVRAGPA